MSNATAKADTAECPFCAREVDSDLVAYGGKCPFCFGDIPGEEAPTDPGEAKKKAEHKAIAAKVQRGKGGPLFLLTMLMVIPLCGAAFILLKPTPRMPALDLDDGENAIDIAMVVEADVPPSVVPVIDVPDPTGSKRGTTPGGSIAKLGNGSKATNDGVVDTSGIGGAAPESGHGTGPRTPGKLGDPNVVVPNVNMGTTSGTGGGLKGPTLGGPARRATTGVMLVDDNQIIEMAKQVVAGEMPKLRYQCYDPILKRNEDLQGSWLLNFTVRPNGSVAEVSATPKPGTTANGELEACLVQKLGFWKFQPIKAELPITKTAKFVAG